MVLGTSSCSLPGNSALMRSPDTSKIKQKMIYASSKDGLRKKLDGVYTEIQCTDLSEVSHETVLDKVSSIDAGVANDCVKQRVNCNKERNTLLHSAASMFAICCTFSLQIFMSDLVRSHYNARPDQGLRGRKESPIIQMRNFNNFIKARLIATCTPKEAKVLDIACGKGGDLLKWKQANIKSLVGLDIANVSIEQATRRYNNGRFRFRATYRTLDCFTVTNNNVAKARR
jgi:hypothetical protein